MGDVTLFGMTIFDLFDFVTAKLMLPLGGMLISVFTGWQLERKVVRDEVTNGGKLHMPFFGLYIFLLKYVAPLCIAFIFINELFL